MRRFRFVHADAWWIVLSLILGAIGAGLVACHVTPLPVPNRQDWEPAGPMPDGWASAARDGGGADGSPR